MPKRARQIIGRLTPQAVVPSLLASGRGRPDQHYCPKLTGINHGGEVFSLTNDGPERARTCALAHLIRDGSFSRLTSVA